MNRVIELVPFAFAVATGFLLGLGVGIWLCVSGRIKWKSEPKTDLILPGQS